MQDIINALFQILIILALVVGALMLLGSFFTMVWIMYCYITNPPKDDWIQIDPRDVLRGNKEYQAWLSSRDDTVFKTAEEIRRDFE